MAKQTSNTYWVPLLLTFLMGLGVAQNHGLEGEVEELREYHSGNGSLQIESRIQGGKATGKIVPYTVVFIETYQGRQVQFCTGSYLGDQWVMLAAHCLPLPANTHIHLGVYDTRKKAIFTTTPAGEWGAPTYSDVTLEGDLALVKLRSKPPASPSIKPVCLGGYRKMDGVPITGYGWGLMNCGGVDKSSDVLKQMTGVGSDYCDDFGGRKETRICAWYKRDGQPDKGDSGGPVVINAGRNPLQVGVMSLTRYSLTNPDCPDPTKLFEYTRVSEYFPWIKSKYPGVCLDGAPFGRGSSSSPPGRPSYGRPLSPPKSQQKPNRDFYGRPIQPQSPPKQKPQVDFWGRPIIASKPQKPSGVGLFKSKPQKTPLSPPTYNRRPW